MRSDFDLQPNLIYLNSGSHSICPRAVTDATIHELREFERNPTLALSWAYKRLWDVQQRVGSFFGAQGKDLFLTPNVTAAMNAFVLGMPMGPGSIAITNLEYGAIANLCKLRAERDSRDVVNVSVPLVSNIDVGAIVAQLRSDTRMLVVSHVMTGTGHLMPLAELAHETRRRGILLVVDGAHALGYVDVDFGRLGDVDFYGANLHKWMMGPKGTGFGWVHPKHQAALQPLWGGWMTFDIPEYFRGFGGGSAFQGRMVVNGCQNFAPFFAIGSMLDYWESRGRDKIVGRIQHLQSEVERVVDSKLGWKKLSPAIDRRGPLVTYALPESIAKRGYWWMYDLLERTGVQIAVVYPGGVPAVRFSPHVYIAEEDIARAVDLIAKEG